MPKYHVVRSTLIDASPESVFDTVADFNTWTSWSPWLCCEPDANVVVSEDSSSIGSLYTWEGELVGQGEVEHVKLERGKLIEEELRFIKPFNSLARVVFEFAPRGNGTEVTWHMYGSLPWFLFWMKSSMDAFLGSDYERGLRMLKEKIETGEVQTRTTIKGVQSVGPLKMIGARKQCAMSEVGSSMESVIQRVEQAFAEASVAIDGQCMSAYHKWDMKAKTTEYTCGFIVDPSVEIDAPGIETWSIGEMQALCVEHVGSYEHLGNGWSAAHQYARSKKLKQAKLAAFEIYRNGPEDTPPSDLVTEIFLLLR